MRALNRDQILSNLRGKIGDRYDYIQRNYPVATACPTCEGLKVYEFRGQAHECDCELQALLQQHYFAANIGREYQVLCIEDFFPGPDRDMVVPVLEAYVDNWSSNYHYGIGLTFNGPLGTGKTMAMTVILKELVKQGVRAYFVTFEDLINTWGTSYKDNDAKEVLEQRMKRAEILGLDEWRVDGRSASGFLANGLDSVLRHRTSNLLPTLVTTNMTRTQEEADFGKAYSLLSAKNERLTFRGRDQRQDRVRQETFDLRNRDERRPIC